MMWLRGTPTKRRPSVLPRVLTVVCVLLIGLAPAQRRLWERDLNRLDPSVKNGEAGKVINLLAELESVPPVHLPSVRPVLERQPQIGTPIVTTLRALGHPDTRAPPR